MNHEVKIAGETVTLAWSQESQRRFVFRMGEIGGEPSRAQLSNPKTVSTALFKILWALLPSVVFAKYSTPEDLYAAVDHQNEAEKIFLAIDAIYAEATPSVEKKSTLKKSRSQKSS